MRRRQSEGSKFESHDLDENIALSHNKKKIEMLINDESKTEMNVTQGANS